VAVTAARLSTNVDGTRLIRLHRPVQGRSEDTPT
jgi:hypothetical protein